MAIGAILVVGGVIYVMDAVEAVERQMADLDPDERRAQSSLTSGAWGIGVAAIGLVLFLFAGLTYLISSVRTSRRGLVKEILPRVVGGVAAAAVVLVFLFLLLAPSSPVLTAVAIASGGGGPSDAVQVQPFEGELTAASFAGQTNEEGVHTFTPAAARGAIKVRMGYGGEGVSPRLVAILEASDGAGGWRELGRTDGQADSEFILPVSTYAGDLRVRVRMLDGTAGSAQYKGGISFSPQSA